MEKQVNISEQIQQSYFILQSSIPHKLVELPLFINFKKISQPAKCRHWILDHQHIREKSGKCNRLQSYDVLMIKKKTRQTRSSNAQVRDCYYEKLGKFEACGQNKETNTQM
ncbi:UNKNOWN [Stylonychia lemnae]|uniref:Uncharacterized protein n=1 Tax=Stylonychia lemnae TaxID=5949 RepID=A0A078A5Y8_STYLE|nr:UNKNOWN [Stylonychia lemnae]|eukprot:CDW77609.1 UNKNOWN [Stylonychia lemnae]